MLILFAPEGRASSLAPLLDDAHPSELALAGREAECAVQVDNREDGGRRPEESDRQIGEDENQPRYYGRPDIDGLVGPAIAAETGSRTEAPQLVPQHKKKGPAQEGERCLLYTSDAADE